jgi:hypothetical protein
MSEHKFRIGQAVDYEPPPSFYASRGTYIVTAVLPERAGQFEYHIRTASEEFERVAKGGELRAMADDDGRGTAKKR